MSGFRQSVVVPIYNGLAYLENCLDSVLGQLADDCECVVVDDGSNAETVAALKRYEEAHAAANLRVVYASHGGASHARNLGLEAARGRFVCFLDGDDRLHDGFLAKSSNWLEQDVDLVVFAFDRVENGVATRLPLQPKVYDSPAQFADHYIVDRHPLVYSQCNKFYRKSVIDRWGIRFEESVEFGEDRLFNFRFIEKCGRIATSPDCMFDYICRGGDSMSTRRLPDFARKLMALHDAKMKTFLGLAETVSDEQRRAFVQYDLSRVVEEAVGHFMAHPEEIAESLPVVNRIVFGDFVDCKESFDVLIVLGSLNCQYRAEKALEVARRNPLTICVASGGNRHQEGLESEAEFMHGYLIGHGVPSDRVILEDRSRNTFENLSFSMELVRRRIAFEGGGRKTVRIGVISGAFHLPRVREILGGIVTERKAEIRFVPAYGPNTGRESWFEHPASVKLIVEEIRKRRGER